MADIGSWIAKAACRDEDPELFFPVGPEPSDAQLESARSVCRHCPVWRQCLVYAVETAQTGGIWAGTTERDRRALREEALHAARA